jgi:hypothetical protein
VKRAKRTTKRQRAHENGRLAVNYTPAITKFEELALVHGRYAAAILLGYYVEALDAHDL